MSCSFANVDLAILSGTRRWLSIRRHVSTYDIACQFFIKWLKRRRWALEQMKEFVSFTPDPDAWDKILFVPTIGKFHAPAHKKECMYDNGLDFKEGVGRTDGEGQERVWSGQNGLANRTREMTEGHRHDTFNHYHEFRNQHKTATLREFVGCANRDVL